MINSIINNNDNMEPEEYKRFIDRMKKVQEYELVSLNVRNSSKVIQELTNPLTNDEFLRVLDLICSGSAKDLRLATIMLYNEYVVADAINDIPTNEKPIIGELNSSVNIFCDEDSVGIYPYFAPKQAQAIIIYCNAMTKDKDYDNSFYLHQDYGNSRIGVRLSPCYGTSTLSCKLLNNMIIPLHVEESAMLENGGLSVVELSNIMHERYNMFLPMYAEYVDAYETIRKLYSQYKHCMSDVFYSAFDINHVIDNNVMQQVRSRIRTGDKL